MTTASMCRRCRKSIASLAGAVAITTSIAALPAGAAVAATGPSPIPVTPFSGYSPLLARAPYVTDLAQTSAAVTWASTSSALGTLEWGPAGNCTAYAAPVPDRLPSLVPASGSPPSATGRQFKVGSTSEFQSTVVLSGLSPSTSYCYRPLSGGTGPVDLLGSNPSQSFTTLASVGDAPSTPITFDVVGDLGETRQSAGVGFPNDLNTDQAAIDSLIGSSGAQFVATAGDVAYSGGTQNNYGDLQHTGDEISDVFGPSYWPETGGLPSFTASGNHGQNVLGLRTWPESTTAAHDVPSAGTYAYDSYPAPTLDGTKPGTYPDSWYAVSSGNVRIYMLDAAWADGSNVGNADGAVCGAAGSSAAKACQGYQVDHDEHWTTVSPEYQWLAADLAAHPGGVKMAVWHYPVRSDNPTQPSDVYLQNSAQNPTASTSLEALLAANGVQVVFNGHTHNYQRIAPDNYQQNGQVVNYVTGGGGGILEPVTGGGTCAALQQSEAIYAIGWSPTSNSGSNCGSGTSAPSSAAQVYNFLKVTVSGNSVTVTPTNAAGETFDVQTYTYPSIPLPPNTVIDSDPSGLTSSTSATISFHSAPAGATFACSLDGTPATACASPVTYTGLAAGSHTFAVTAANSSGADPTPAGASWTVDTSPPSIPIDLTTNSATSSAVDLSWTASTDDTGIAGYDILRDGEVIGSISGTTTTYADTTVAPSTTYQYSVDARDGAGNTSPASADFTVATPAPSTSPLLVQSAGSSSTTVTLATPSTPGDLLVLSAGVFTGATKPITAVTDSASNRWVKVPVEASFVSGHNSDGEMWYAPGAGSVSTVTVATSAPAVALQLQEFSGVAVASPLDGSTGTAAAGTSASSGQATPTISNDLAVGFIAGHGDVEAPTSTSPGYLLQPQVTTTSPSKVTVESGYQNLSSTGGQSFGGSFARAMYWAAGIALFEPASPPPPDDFSMAAAPAAATVTAGSATTTTITTALTGGKVQPVVLGASGAPVGTTVSFDPPTISSGQSSVATITTEPSTPGGTSAIVLTGTGTSVTRSAPLSLTFTAAPQAPAITSNDATTFAAGATGSFTVTSTARPIASLSEAGALPSGVSFVDNGNGSATLSGTAATGSVGVYPLTISAANGVGGPAAQSFTLTVASASQPQLVQSAGATEGGPAPSLTGSFPTATTGGDLLVLSASVYTGLTNQITGVTDSAGNAWVRIGAFCVGGHNSDGEMWYSAGSRPATTVTAHTSSAASIAFEVQEFSGIAADDPLDVSSGSSDSSASASSGPATPSSADELAVGFIAGHANAEPMAVVTPGYTVQPEQTTTGPTTTVVTGYRLLDAPGAQVVAGSFSGAMYWAAGIAVFRPSG